MILIGAAADWWGADRTGVPGSAIVSARIVVMAASAAYRRVFRDIGDSLPRHGEQMVAAEAGRCGRRQAGGHRRVG
ncbi:hypothetical protein TPA0907_31710 [Micromonospora humidisoli]|nr:hypothetical protein TPA0907_31710 [Micromonospora sp. AKA109]